MKAIVLEQAGGVENLLIKEIEKPTIKDHEVLVSVKAISVNPVDYKVRGNEAVIDMIMGNERPVILGWDIAGIVTETGSKVSKFQKGDLVFGMVNFVGRGNAYAEFVAAPENHLAKIPDGVSFEEAAATTLAALTALQVLQPRVKKGDKVLIHAGSGGVGHFAIQIAKSLGAFVITTSSAKNKAFVMSLGSDEFIDYRSQNFEEVLSDLDFVFDMFNGDILLNSIKVVKDGGTIISLPTPDFSEDIHALAKEHNVDVQFLMVQSNEKDMETLAGLLENGSIKPHISNTFNFNNMGKAHLQLESGRTVGKVVVTV
ncbi:NADP-dependent oxidoreductase [Croceitalea rosinachiae]|uniref:NADP-dependent oxidoreductase n=1 Tax=Croceitalea rosinachiae TaxID=3075596 RepID=A0ABU3A9J8_9FLAO|nr:NADP-dependent oxidoreductase [Croceitalea sp. F388]MDT0606862.1 NADP-dependent oxidoreductase [Croceitalea sp. F388]